MANILTVCTGNICRSPVAALLLREYLGDVAEISGAGTHAMVGHGIPAQMLMPLDAASIDGRDHRARQVTSAIAADQDLIIVMTAQHRTAVVQETPAVLRRTFLLDELAKAAQAGVELEGDDVAHRIAAVPAAIQGFRPELAGMDVQDVPDPYRRSQRRYDEAYAMIEASVRDIADWIRG